MPIPPLYAPLISWKGPLSDHRCNQNHHVPQSKIKAEPYFRETLILEDAVPLDPPSKLESEVVDWEIPEHPFELPPDKQT